MNLFPIVTWIRRFLNYLRKFLKYWLVMSVMSVLSFCFLFGMFVLRVREVVSPLPDITI